MPIFILLFWLSLAPFATAWMGQNHLVPAPVALYGFILLSAGIGYFILTRSLVAHHRQGSKLVKSVGNDRKGLLSMAIYAIAIALAFAKTWAAYVCTSRSRDVDVARPTYREGRT